MKHHDSLHCSLVVPSGTEWPLAMPREHSMPATQSNCFISSTISLFLPWFFQPGCKLFNATFNYGQNVYIVHYTFLFLSEVFHTKKLKRFGHLRHFSMGWAHMLCMQETGRRGGGELVLILSVQVVPLDPPSVDQESKYPWEGEKNPPRVGKNQ